MLYGQLALLLIKSSIGIAINYIRSRFHQSYISNLIETNYPDLATHVLKNPILYGDYKTALDDNEPRLYEDLIDYHNVKALFTEVAVLQPRFDTVHFYGTAI